MEKGRKSGINTLETLGKECLMEMVHISQMMEASNYS